MPMGGGMAGFLQSFTQTAGQQIDKQHAAEEEKKRRIREDQWKILSQYQADPGAFDPEFIKQTQQEFLKGLNGESKKSAVKVFGIFDKFRSGNKQQGQGQQQPQQGQTQKQQGGPLQPPQPQAAASPQPAAQGSAGPLQPPQGQPKAAGGPLQPPQAAAAPPQGGAPPQAPAAAPAQPEAQPPQNGPRMFRTPEERDATEAAARQQRITALKKEAEDQFGLKGRDAADYVNAHMGAKELPREAAAPKPTALDLMKQVEGILADENASEADKKAAQDIKDAHAVKSTNKKFVWGKPPGSDTAVLAYTDPKDPKGFYDPETNEKIDGFTPGATPQTQRLYGAVLGYYYKFLGQNNPATGKPYSDTEAREKAGQMFTEREGIHLGRVEQQAQIDGALSGISIGPGFSKEFKTPAAPASGTTPTAQPKSTAAPTGAKPPATIGAKAAASAEKDKDNILYYLGSLTGTQKAGGKAAGVRAIEGQKALAKATGLDPVTLSASLTENQALGKQLGETIQREYAIDRLTNTLDVHGDRLLEAASKLIQAGSPALQGPWRKAIRNVEGSPELAKYRVFATDVQREYGYLTAGGAQSRAMLPVTVSENMEHLFSEDATLEEIVTSLKAVRTSAANEKGAMEKTRGDIVNEMQSGAVGTAVRGNGKLKPPSAGANKKNDPLGVLQ